MNRELRAAMLGALLAAPLAALAQPSPRTPDPADPGAAVAPIVYESVFTRPAQAPQDAQPTPDKVWRAANEAVAGPAGHAGHGAHQGGAAGNADAGPQPAAQPAPAPVDHSKHH